LIAVIQIALWELGIAAKIDKIEENHIIRSYKIIKTPAMLIDEKVIFEGFVPGISEIKKIIRQFSAQ
jgi:hypothetical protein